MSQPNVEQVTAKKQRRLINFLWVHVVPYLSVIVIVSLVGLWRYQPWNGLHGAVLTGGGDTFQVQATYEVAGQQGIFGFDPHLSWPAGFNIWSQPQLGYFLPTVAWLLIGGLSVSSAAATLLLQVVIMVLTGCAVLFLFRSVATDSVRIAAIVLAIGFAVSPYLLNVAFLGHQNVSFFVAIPVGLGVLIRGRGRSLRWWFLRGAPAIAVTIALGPLWWDIVLVLVLAGVCVGFLLQRRWMHLKEVCIALGACAIGAATQYVVFRSAVVNTGLASRGPWDSNVYGGHLTDFVAGSPTVNSWFPNLNKLVEGSSVEFRQAGLLCALAAIFLVLLLVKGLPTSVKMGDRNFDTRLITIASIVGVLFFLTGGFGNLQAGLAVAIGGQSPARVWSRLVMLIAVMGILWALVYLKRWLLDSKLDPKRIRVWYGAFLVAVLAVIFVELANPLPAPSITAASKMPEYGAVSFIEQSVAPCPVAQLPQDGFPIPRIALTNPPTKDQVPYYYRGVVPYLIAPNYYWSYGSWIPKARSTLNGLHTTLTAQDVNSLKAAGFCAVLFDKSLAAQLIAGGMASKEGMIPGALGSPDYPSNRFDAYLLTKKAPAAP